MNSNRAIKYKRGSIWWVDLKQIGIASGVQSGTRPCVIISSDDGNATNQTVIVALITSQDKGNIPINTKFINIDNDDNVVLGNQVHTVSKNWLSKYSGVMTEKGMIQIEKSIATALDMTMQHIDLSELTVLVDKLIESRVNRIKEENKISAEDIVNRLIGNINDTLDNEVGKVTKNNKKEVTNKNSNTTKQIKKKTTNKKKTTKKKTTRKSNKQKNSNRKPYGYWTLEKMQEFVADKENLETSALKEKYEIENENSLTSMYYTFKKKIAIK